MRRHRGGGLAAPAGRASGGGGGTEEETGPTTEETEKIEEKGHINMAYECVWRIGLGPIMVIVVNPDCSGKSILLYIMLYNI